MTQGMQAALVMVLGGVMVSTAHCQLPDAPSYTPRTVDKGFVALAALNAGVTFADGLTTVQVRGPGNRCNEVWGRALYGVHPTVGRTAVVMGGIAVATTAAAYVLKRKHARVWRLQLWQVPLVWQTYTHAQGLASNVSSTCR